MIKLFTSCLTFALLFIENIKCQAIEDGKTNHINFFFEMLNPQFRHHRARLRPFLQQLGAPVINIRGTRDVSQQMKKLGIKEKLIF